MWEELVKIALLGTERSALSPTLQAHLLDLGISPQQAKTDIILQAASFYSQMNKVGIILPDYSKDLPKAIRSTETQICSPKSTHHLQLILEGTFAPALPEFILHLHRNKKELSPKNLPALLGKCLESAVFFQKIKPVLGKRGWWLIAQNPRWADLQYFPKEADWQSDNILDKVKYLKFYRQHEPQQGFEFLREVWETAPFQNKLAFLDCLPFGLSLDDEAFLEDALYDSRKEVRSKAADLLAQLPASELVERIFMRLEDLMRYEQGQLKVYLPDELDETAIRDGLVINGKGKYGEQQSVLCRMFSKVPPNRWETYFARSIPAIVQLLQTNQWAAVMIDGIFQASLRFQNKHWAQALLQFYLEVGNTAFWQSLDLKALLALLPDAAFNEIALSYFDQHKQLLNEKSSISLLLLHSTHQWEDKLTYAVILRFRNWLQHGSSPYLDKSFYQRLLKNTSYRCSAHSFEALKKGWDRTVPAWGLWEKEIEDFLKTIIFRKEMIGALEKEG